MSGAFGGKDDQLDSAHLDVTFTAGAGPLLDLTLGGFTAADRGNLTKVLRDSATGTVPAGTRTVQLRLTADNTFAYDSYNDGYADDISLLLPEPSAAAGEVAVLALLAVRRGATRRRSERP